MIETLILLFIRLLKCKINEQAIEPVGSIFFGPGLGPEPGEKKILGPGPDRVRFYPAGSREGSKFSTLTLQHSFQFVFQKTYGIILDN